MGSINVAIAGIGNCASNVVQGIEYYRNNMNETKGLISRIAGGFDVTDINIVAAFDIAQGKVGKDISEAIWASPNCTERMADVPEKGVIVQKGPVLDGWDDHLKDVVVISDEETCDVEKVLRDSKAEVLVVLLPTGSTEACLAYIRTALKLGISVVNGIPVLASHDPEIVALAEENGACIIGDDFKSQIGGTILHHALLHLLKIRGVDIQSTYQLNYAGNTDFLNLSTKRGMDKHASKARGITFGIKEDMNLSVNTSFLPNKNDNKTCLISIEGSNFGGCPVTVDCKLTVVDSSNSSGVLVDAIRCLAVARKRGMKGRLDAPSAWFMKSPCNPMQDEDA